MTERERPAHHLANGGFRNPWPGFAPHGLAGFARWMLERARSGRFGPPTPAPALARGATEIVRPRAPRGEDRITAIGHSSFLLQWGGMNVLTDPVFADRCSPLRWAGPRRRQPPGIALEELPPIDLVLLSHDHYDHLDDLSVRALASRHPEALWCAPLGVSGRLRDRGVQHIAEQDWWDGFSHGRAEITCVPAAHFSGRTPFDRNRTLWCGWWLSVGDRHLYFAGDSGLHPDFVEIGARLGPCDAALLPVGAYAPRWFMRPVHMDPDDAIDAFAALTQKHPSYPTVMVAMHWGTFQLADEPPDEPPRRALDGWRARGGDPERLWLLSPGETRRLGTAP